MFNSRRSITRRTHDVLPRETKYAVLLRVFAIPVLVCIRPRLCTVGGFSAFSSLLLTTVVPLRAVEWLRSGCCINFLIPYFKLSTSSLTAQMDPSLCFSPCITYLSMMYVSLTASDVQFFLLSIATAVWACACLLNLLCCQSST